MSQKKKLFNPSGNRAYKKQLSYNLLIIGEGPAM